LPSCMPSALPRCRCRMGTEVAAALRGACSPQGDGHHNAVPSHTEFLTLPLIGEFPNPSSPLAGLRRLPTLALYLDPVHLAPRAPCGALLRRADHHIRVRPSAMGLGHTLTTFCALAALHLRLLDTPCWCLTAFAVGRGPCSGIGANILSCGAMWSTQKALISPNA
jgi:hypothetical protein